MEISNLRTGRVRRHALLLGASMLFALSLAGVAARPSLGRQAVELALAEAEQRVEERRTQVEVIGRFEASGGIERVRAALERLGSLIPAPLPDLELHGLLRLLCARSGVELKALELGEPFDPGFERLGDVAALREVRLEGEGRMKELLALQAAVRGLGRPVSVLEFRFANPQARERSSFTLVLGLFESRPLDAFPEELVPSAENQP